MTGAGRPASFSEIGNGCWGDRHMMQLSPHSPLEGAAGSGTAQKTCEALASNAIRCTPGRQFNAKTGSAAPSPAENRR
jgi:hypothetical protein